MISTPASFPQEILDGILELLPRWDTYSENGFNCPSKILFACSEVSRSFALAARRCIFSELNISEGRHRRGDAISRIRQLLKLLEETAGPLEHVQAVRIRITSSDLSWASQSDEELQKILDLLQKRPRNLSKLYIDFPCFKVLSPD